MLYLVSFEIFRFKLKLILNFADGLAIILNPDDLVNRKLVELD